jgi:hypothetical protein
MINSILKYPILYRMYQKSVRSKNNEYDFFKFIFSNLKKNKIRMLDIACGDSFILNYVSEYLEDYLGVDHSDKYLIYSKNKWKNFNFLNLDLNNKENIKYLNDFRPNFIFMNGVIHHLDNVAVNSVNSFVESQKESIFLSVDPIKHENKVLNKIMIKYDRGKYIRSRDQYYKLMKNFKSDIIDDFYKMSFKQIFHHKNLNLSELYSSWKNSISK